MALAAASSVAQRRADRRASLVTALLLAPTAVWFLILLIMPLLVLLVFSLGERGPVGGYQAALTLKQYASLGTRLSAFQNTIVLAPAGTLISVLVSYPLAYYLALRASPRWRYALLILVILPFWTSLLIRTYAWMFILGGKGLPSLLMYFGLPPIQMINTSFAVLVGIVYAYMPLMVLPIFVSLERLDKRLLDAAADLGSSPLRSFLTITLPLSMPGVVTGSLMVCILLMGEFLIPSLLGGGKIFFVGNALVDLFLQSRNWPLGAAMALTMVAVMLVLISTYVRLTMGNAGRGRRSLS